MRRGAIYNFIPPVLLAVVFAGEALAAAKPRTPLLQARVADAANQAVQFVSFMPTNKNDLVWADDSRRTAWSRRVAEKMGLDLAGNVALVPFSEPFHVSAKEPELEFLLQAGMKGSETLSARLDSGRRVSMDNQFEVVSVSRSAVSVVWRRASKSPFRLRCEQGAGQDMWFVTGDELEARWSQMLKRGKGANVRREVNLVLESLERESTSIGKGDREGWRDWLFEFKERTPATWPSIVFQNSYSGPQGRPGPVVVTCGGETSPEIPPNGSWTKSWVNWKGPPTSPVAWTFRAPGDNLLDDDFGRQLIETWSPKGGMSNVLVQVDAQPKPRPYLILGRDEFAIPDIWAALAPSGEENQVGDLKVTIIYGDEPKAEFSGARDARRRLLPNADGKAWNWKVELLPNAEIREIVVSSPAYLADTTLHLDKTCYKCGETAHVRDGEKANPLPWPTVSVRNESEFPVACELSVVDADGATAASVSRIEDVKPGVTEDFDLAKIWDLPATNVSVRIVGTAPGANDGRADIDILRGGRAVSRNLKLAYTPVEWVPLDGRLGLIEGVWSRLVLDSTFQNIDTPGKYLSMCNAQIFTDPTFQKILDHYVRCKNKGCMDCRDLRTRTSAQGQKTRGAPTNVADLWNEMVPGAVPQARGRGADMVAVLLALCDEYYEEELDRDPLQRQAYENIAKRLRGEWP